eukprot:g8814.t1
MDVLQGGASSSSSSSFHQRQVAGRAVFSGETGPPQDGATSLPPPARFPSAETAPAALDTLFAGHPPGPDGAYVPAWRGVKPGEKVRK